MNSDPIVISRHIVDENGGLLLRHNRLSSFRPYEKIVEHNGKQFLVELKLRIERRQVEYFDETKNKIRRFDVIDRIPYRTIRAYPLKSQSSLQRKTIQDNFPSSLQVNQQSTIKNNQLQPSTSPNLIHQNNTHNYDKFEKISDSRSNNKNGFSGSSQTSSQSNSDRNSQFKPNHRTKLAYHASKYSASDSSTTSTSSESYVSQSRSANSNTSESSQNYRSINSSYSNNEERNSNVNQKRISNRNQIDGEHRNRPYQKENAYTKTDNRRSPTPIDLFARSVPPHEHYYRKRPTVNNYSQPTMNTGRFRSTINRDYAPIPNILKQIQQTQF